MELRHLRYFVAVAEEGSLTNAAERRLHTAQPSLSRQIRDLELEVGVPLLERGARGIALTAAAAPFSIMRGWRCFKSKQRAKPRGAPHSQKSAPSRSAFSPARN
jgi:Bacterial regulatory helix-turn-helix protein, lysR family